MGTTPPCFSEIIKQNASTISDRTHCKEYPLQRFAIFVRVLDRVPSKLVVPVIVLLEIEKDGSGLEDGIVVPVSVDEDGNASVWVQFDEPRFLWMNVECHS